MDAFAGRLPRAGALVVVTASYQGKAPDNAGAFLAWVEGLRAGALDGVRYCVLGCGDRKWAKTFQAIPTRVDAALDKAGATRLRERGVLDADRDLASMFDAWFDGLWGDLAIAAPAQALTE